MRLPLDANVNRISALADPTRQAVLQLLRGQPMSVGEIAARLPVSRPAVSQHLQVLANASLVKEQRSGTKHYFSLNPEGFADVQAYISSMWQDALNSFAGFAAGQEMKRRKARRRRE